MVKCTFRGIFPKPRKILVRAYLEGGFERGLGLEGELAQQLPPQAGLGLALLLLGAQNLIGQPDRLDRAGQQARRLRRARGPAQQRAQARARAPARRYALSGEHGRRT